MKLYTFIHKGFKIYRLCLCTFLYIKVFHCERIEIHQIIP